MSKPYDPAKMKACLKPMFARDNLRKGKKRPPTHQGEFL